MSQNENDEVAFCNAMLKGDVIETICEFLHPADILNIRTLMPHRSNRLYKHYIASIGRAIDDWFRNYFGQHYLEFRRCMIEDKCVVSGSFIIQIMLGEAWENSDIDIFLPDSDYHLDWYLPIQKLLYIMHDEGSDCLPGRYTDVFGRNNIARICNYVKPDNNPQTTSISQIPLHADEVYGKSMHRTSDHNKFQLVELLNCKTIEQIKTFIHSNFDLDICKNTFYYDASGYHLDLTSPLDIVKRQFKAGKSPNGKSNQYRVDRYLARGFKLYKDTSKTATKDKAVL